MTVRLDHTFVHARDARRAARDLADTLGLPEPSWSGPFPAVRLDDGTLLEFVEVTGEVTTQHYAFAVTEDDFDAVLARLRQQGRPFWAGPLHHGPGQINRWGGGRGFYFNSEDGHAVEVLTRPFRGGVGGAADPVELVRLVAEAYNGGDAEAAARLFEPGAVLAVAPGETVTGAALRDSIGGFMGRVRHMEIRIRHIYQAGGVALLVTDHVTDLDGPDGPGGAPVRVTGTATDVARRGADGRWRYLIDNPSGSGH
ncbi:DUF4440 domain-containing protein [Dactylosporangium sp. NPDC051485]|uniref:DUF4440 domain-containing protein n=1 Tax=Dactylosporangium sp. NPDC051485 TaxID=3154846 RepID=UPI00343A38D1